MTRPHLTRTTALAAMCAALATAAITITIAAGRQTRRFADLLEELDDLVANLDRGTDDLVAEASATRLELERSWRAAADQPHRTTIVADPPTTESRSTTVIVDGDHVVLIYPDGGRKIITNRADLWTTVSTIGTHAGVDVPAVEASMLDRHPGVRRVEALPTAALMWGVRRIVTQLVTPPHRGGAQPRHTSPTEGSTHAS